MDAVLFPEGGRLVTQPILEQPVRATDTDEIFLYDPTRVLDSPGKGVVPFGVATVNPRWKIALLWENGLEWTAPTFSLFRGHTSVSAREKVPDTLTPITRGRADRIILEGTRQEPLGPGQTYTYTINDVVVLETTYESARDKYVQWVLLEFDGQPDDDDLQSLESIEGTTFRTKDKRAVFSIGGVYKQGANLEQPMLYMTLLEYHVDDPSMYILSGTDSLVTRAYMIRTADIYNALFNALMGTQQAPWVQWANLGKQRVAYEIRARGQRIGPEADVFATWGPRQVVRVHVDPSTYDMEKQRAIALLERIETLQKVEDAQLDTALVFLRANRTQPTETLVSMQVRCSGCRRRWARFVCGKCMRQAYCSARCQQWQWEANDHAHACI